MAKKTFRETWQRSLAKAVIYRGIIVFLDFFILYILTKQIVVAAGFTIVSNIYTTAGYYAHERIWDKIRWGKIAKK